MTGILISVPKLTSLSAKLIIAFDVLMKFKPKMISCFKYGVIMTGTFCCWKSSFVVPSMCISVPLTLKI